MGFHETCPPAASLALGLAGSILLAARSALPYETRRIQESGDPANRIDIAIAGDGYTAAEQPKLEADARMILASLFSVEPYATYRSFFNATVIFVESRESGVDGINGEKDTALDGTTSCGGNAGILCANYPAAMMVAAEAAPEHDYLIVVLNAPIDAGSSGPLVMLGAGSRTGILLAHELGHLIGNLADEYDRPYPGYPPCPEEDCAEPNVTKRFARQDIKWLRWIEDTTPIPTPETHTTEIGLFPGARYEATGIYRPKLDCRMRTNGRAEFCEVCREALIEALYQKVSPIDRALPPARSFLAMGETSLISVDRVDAAPISVTWFVDGVRSHISGDDFLLDSVALGSGPHEIRVRVQDDTTDVRRRDRDRLGAEQVYAIEVGPDVCGDGIVSGPELCDLGINVGGYGGCKPGCLSLPPRCGDGILNGPEACDDGNSEGDDGCSPSCTIESGCGCGITVRSLAGSQDRASITAELVAGGLLLGIFAAGARTPSVRTRRRSGPESRCRRA